MAGGRRGAGAARVGLADHLSGEAGAARGLVQGGLSPEQGGKGEGMLKGGLPRRPATTTSDGLAADT